MKKKNIKIQNSLTVKAAAAIALVAAFLFVKPIYDKYNEKEPLADPATLKMLTKGLPIPMPKNETIGQFLDQKFIALPPTAYKVTKYADVLGVNAADKRIEVDLTNQKVYAFENNSKVYEFTVSTGKWGRTPTGTFDIWAKIRSQKMSGGSKELGTYYYLPNVPYVMFFYNNEITKYRGFSFHGTYWHSNFGHPMSHGCINMKTEEAKILYDWATPVVTNDKTWATYANTENPGTRVVIYGVTPKE